MLQGLDIDACEAQLRALVAAILAEAKRQGASAAEVAAAQDAGLSVQVRKGALETVEFTRIGGLASPSMRVSARAPPALPTAARRPFGKLSPRLWTSPATPGRTPATVWPMRRSCRPAHRIWTCSIPALWTPEPLQRRPWRAKPPDWLRTSAWSIPRAPRPALASPAKCTATPRASSAAAEPPATA